MIDFIALLLATFAGMFIQWYWERRANRAFRHMAMAATNPSPVVITPEGLARALSIVGTLPSRFQLGDTVRARGVVGMVSGVCFREAKVFYEVGGVMHASDDVTEPLRVVSACPSCDRPSEVAEWCGEDPCPIRQK